MDDIVKRLRRLAEEHYEMLDDVHLPMTEAADLITALRAENEKLRAALEAICMMGISWVGDAFELKDIARAAIAKAEKEGA